MKIRFPRFRLLRKLFSPITRLYRLFRVKHKKSIRMQLIVTFGICLIASMISYDVSNEFFNNSSDKGYIDYTNGRRSIDANARSIVQQLTNNYFKLGDTTKLQEYIDRESQYNPNIKILIVDINGKVLFKSKNSSESQIDLFTSIKNAMDMRNFSENSNDSSEFISFYPVNMKSDKGYVVVSGIPQGNIKHNNYRRISPLSPLVALFIFMFLFHYLTSKKMIYIEELANGLFEISKGNLEFRVEEKSEDELGSLANNINFMANELQNKMEQERKTEKTKSELITNVSHDLRTPLTSIMGYLRLVKDNKYETREQMQEYINISYGKSEKLKVLIEDLFEYTKFSNEGVALNKQVVTLNKLLNQLIEELVPISEERNITFVKDFPLEEINVYADGDKLVRVFENLLTNSIKYSYASNEIKVRLFNKENDAVISIENKGEPISKDDIEHLFDRFYRLEKSRSSETGGSGLGLAIAKSIIELHGGEIWAECDGEDIRFLIKIKTVQDKSESNNETI